MSTDTDRPFHETIIGAIKRCPSSPSTGEIFRLFKHIETTKIPKGHEEIIAAIDQYFDFPGGKKWARDVKQVKESILRKKQAASETTGKKGKDWKMVDLDEIQIPAQRLAHYLANCQPDSANWNRLMRDTAEQLHKLISRALGK